MQEPTDSLKEYERRLRERTRVLAEHARWENALANIRLVVFIAGAVVAWLALGSHAIHWAWIAIPVAGFVALVVVHDRTLRAMRRLKSGVTYYERGIARIEDRWMGTGWDGADLVPEDHPYAGDLDMFGPSSLFQLLCTAQTRAGGKTLADWLCAPAPIDEIRARQAAVEELRPRIDLREELSFHSRTLETSVLPKTIAAWAEAPPLFRSRALAVVAYGASALAILAGIACYNGAPASVLAIPSIALIVLHLITRRRVHAVTAAAYEPAWELDVVGRVLARLEQEPFESSYLRAVQDGFKDGVQWASAAIARLGQLRRLQEASGNLLFGPFAFVLMWDYHFARAADAWRVRNRATIARWLEGVGRLEAACALASYAYEHPRDPFPAVDADGPVFDGHGLGHPLVAADRCVRNDVKLDTQLKLLIVSGSNMSGKSFMLRTVGINAVLACAGAPVRARELHISPLMVGATLNVHDSIQAGVSRFYAEIKRIRALVEITKGPTPLLFLLDEIMHGTNSQDRRIGARAIVHSLLKAGAIGIVTTHDLALTGLVDDFGGHAVNAHFEDHLQDGQLVFDYRLYPGVVTRSNALDLMRAIGLDVD
ncbi:MAG: DNA mismatch repair protein MutS [Candidatus Hydrogenedentes bacterium]|nr:DNA mismatch repair protein MutS [Candidatus Hydrogenedentota bacterium]